jgi:hypothetical protein
MAKEMLNFAYEAYLSYCNGSLTCRKVLRIEIDVFTFPPKEFLLRIFIALKNPSSWLGFSPRTLGALASTITTIPPRTATYVIKF